MHWLIIEQIKLPLVGCRIEVIITKTIWRSQTVLVFKDYSGTDF